MPLPIEDLTVAIRRATLAERFPGGLAGFVARLPAGPRADDGLLLAFALPNRAALGRLLPNLERAGLATVRGAELVDVAVVAPGEGPLAWCRWLELALVAVPGRGQVLAARAEGDKRTALTLPAGADGLSPRGACVRTLPLTERPLRYLRREGGTAVYRDRFTGAEVRVAQPEPRVRLNVQTRAGANFSVEAEVVSAGELSSLGLMHRDQLAPDAGMLFRMGRHAGGVGFWMKNTRIPLDMCFLDGAGRVVELVEEAAPMTVEARGGNVPYEQVLEVNGGWARRRGVGVGARVTCAETLAE